MSSKCMLSTAYLIHSIHNTRGFVGNTNPRVGGLRQKP